MSNNHVNYWSNKHWVNSDSMKALSVSICVIMKTVFSLLHFWKSIFSVSLLSSEVLVSKILSPGLGHPGWVWSCRDCGPAYTCWEELGSLFFHLSACGNSIHKGKLSQKSKRERLSFFQPLWISGSCTYLIHLEAKLLRSNECEADDLSLRSPKSCSPYLVLLPSADSSSVNVSSNRLQETLLSALHCIPSPCTLKIEPQFI